MQSCPGFERWISCSERHGLRIYDAPLKLLSSGAIPWLLIPCGHLFFVDLSSVYSQRYRGKVLNEAQDGEEIIYADIGRYQYFFQMTYVKQRADPKVFHEARTGIPVTTQRRFDVYADVSQQ